jgi:hypothetical protein
MRRYNLLALNSNQVANPAWNLALSNQATPFSWVVKCHFVAAGNDNAHYTVVSSDLLSSSF